MLVVCWVAAVVSCLGYGVGSVLQSVGARRAAHVTGVTGVALILLQGPYLLGLAADGLAFVANVVALQRLPLFLVQAVLTASVAVTAVVAAIRGEALSRRDWASLGVLGVGLVLLSLSASTESALRVSGLSQWLIFTSLLIPVVLGMVGVRLRGKPSSDLLALSSGLAFTGVAVASRGISGLPLTWHLLLNPLLWTILVQGALGMVFFALALQRGAVTTVTAITFVVEMVIPSILGVVLFGDGVAQGLVVVAVAGFALAVAGTLALARFAEPA
ncbi:hypothetical protein GCM10009841_09670 [Microlunatus panaciterrae]|uniref:Drug/metabolite transporter (DMT)-like permease n=1 Tax=Microlunatus panaciterrae TaxID=400768 RepID=A0ABS2RKH1_9ACTN|nr:hypothetical protein [Microlunatus panaciterrae]MBM7799514.1 drug/metabolite transporter (DMT)-like permease [Microlunatus panaciterrae]